MRFENRKISEKSHKYNRRLYSRNLTVHPFFLVNVHAFKVIHY